MEYLLKVSIVISIFYLFYTLCLKNDTFFQFNRIFLLLGIPISFIIPFIIFNNYIEYTAVSTPTYYQNLETITSPIAIETTETSFSIWQLVPILYIFGIIIFSLNFIVQLIGVFKIIRKSKVVKNDNFIAVETNKDILPFSFFKWVVYNPNSFTNKELKQILAHEKVHVKQNHSLEILTTKIVAVVLWFNPFIWLYLKSIKQNLEFIADATAQENIECTKTYQYTLLKTGFASKQLAITNNFFRSPIKKRIVMLQKRKSKKIYQFKHLLILPILGFFLMNFNTEDIYIEKETTIFKNKENTFLLKNTFDDIQLEKFKSELKEKGYLFTLNEIERNASNLITSIDFEINKNNIKGAYRNYTSIPLKTIVIQYLEHKRAFDINTLEFNEAFNNVNNKNIIEIKIDKNSTEEDLTKKSKFLKEKHNIDFVTKIIEKNNKNEITKFEFTFKNGSGASKQTIGPIGTIQPMVLKYNLQTKELTSFFLDKNNIPQYGNVTTLNTDKKVVIIANHYTNKSLEHLKSRLKNRGVTLEFKNIKRNKDNKIIAIGITAKSKNGSKIKYNQNNTKPITPIAISYFTNGNGLQIGPSHLPKRVITPPNFKKASKKENIIEIIFNKNTTLKKLEEQSKYLKEKYNIDFDFEIENKDEKLADFKYSFSNGIEKHKATISTVFPFSSIDHALILKYNKESKSIWMDAVMDDVTYDATSKRYLDNNVGFYIDNTDTDKILKKYKKLMKEKGVAIEFSNIKRDAKNRITEIKIDTKTQNSKSSHNFKLDGETYNGVAISFYSNGNGLKIKPVLNTF